MTHTYKVILKYVIPKLINELLIFHRLPHFPSLPKANEHLSKGPRNLNPPLVKAHQLGRSRMCKTPVLEMT